jgi:hypothetical protein
MKTSGEPFAGRHARKLGGRPERAALGLALPFPRAKVIGQLLNLRPGLRLLSRGLLAGRNLRHDQE